MNMSEKITSSMVKELRDLTGLGMMECKKALVESSGDINQARDLLRIKAGSKAQKVAGRSALEGTVAIHATASCAGIVEINAETDFVAKDQLFLDFASLLAQTIATSCPNTMEALFSTSCTSEYGNVEEERKHLVMRLGENITIKQFSFIKTQGCLVSYIHPGAKIGVIVDISGKNLAVGKDIAMHIAAMNPQFLQESSIPTELLEREKKLYITQAIESGKPDNIAQEMAAGKTKKFINDNCLIGQKFVKNTEITVADALSQHDCKIESFIRFAVGVEATSTLAKIAVLSSV